jgi:hypothetical protein
LSPGEHSVPSHRPVGLTGPSLRWISGTVQFPRQESQRVGNHPIGFPALARSLNSRNSSGPANAGARSSTSAPILATSIRGDSPAELGHPTQGGTQPGTWHLMMRLRRCQRERTQMRSDESSSTVLRSGRGDRLPGAVRAVGCIGSRGHVRFNVGAANESAKGAQVAAMGLVPKCQPARELDPPCRIRIVDPASRSLHGPCAPPAR